MIQIPGESDEWGGVEGALGGNQDGGRGWAEEERVGVGMGLEQ